MKLLFCELCNSVFNLSMKLKTCECGKVKGKYIDYVNAEVSGNGVSLAIGNGSLIQAIQFMKSMNQGRAFYPVMCWTRPNEGTANPHTKVNEEIK